VWTGVAFPVVRLLRRYGPRLDRLLSGAAPPRQGLGASAFERFTAQQARVGLRLLPTVESQNAVRVANAGYVRDALSAGGVAMPCAASDGRSVFWQNVVYVEQAAPVQSALARVGIDSAPTNLDLVCADVESASCPVADMVKHRALYLPVHPRVRPGDMQRAVECLLGLDQTLLRRGRCEGSGAPER
jgi:dTDP-4-amino-4,6-dideoxygalactose transaminase